MFGQPPHQRQPLPEEQLQKTVSEKTNHSAQQRRSAGCNDWIRTKSVQLGRFHTAKASEVPIGKKTATLRRSTPQHAHGAPVVAESDKVRGLNSIGTGLQAIDDDGGRNRTDVTR